MHNVNHKLKNEFTWILGGYFNLIEYLDKRKA